MSGTWAFLYETLNEASESEKLRQKLLSYLSNKYGKEHATAAQPFIRQLWNANDLPALAGELDNIYKDADGNSDPEIVKIMQGAVAAELGTKQSSGPAVRRRSEPGGSEKSATARRDAIAGLASGQRLSPAEIERQRQATDAMAALRHSDKSGGNMPKAGMRLKPGERPEHDVGTAGQSPGSAPGHTRPVQRQVSQTGDKAKTVAQQLDYLQGLLDRDPDHPQKDKIEKAITKLQDRNPEDTLAAPKAVPTTAGSDLEQARAELEKLRKRNNTLPELIKQYAKRAVAINATLHKVNDPEAAKELKARSQAFAKQAAQMRSELTGIPKKMKDIEQKVAGLTQTGKSGYADLQRQVDTVTKNYGAKVSDKLAKKFGVPTTAERTTTDDEGKQKINIWSSDRIAKWKQSGGATLEPGVYDKVPVHGVDPEKQGPWQGSGPKLPTDRPKPIGPEETPVHKPMMKAPKGLSKDEVAELAKLRRDYAKLKKSGASPEELSLAKEPIDAIMSKSSEMVDTVVPGRFVGDTWGAAGISKDIRTMRPDKATGKFMAGTTTIDPSKTGEKVYWDGNDWVRKSQFVAKRAEKNVDKPTAEPYRRSHAQTVKGTPVSTSAVQQKIAGLTEPEKKKGPTLFQRHKGVKSKIGQAFARQDEPEPEADEPTED